MFELIHKNRKGFSLVELIVCLVVLGLVIPLAGNILYNMINFNNTVIDRWDVQAAVKLVCNDLENNKDGLTNRKWLADSWFCCPEFSSQRYSPHRQYKRSGAFH